MTKKSFQACCPTASDLLACWRLGSDTIPIEDDTWFSTVSIVLACTMHTVVIGLDAQTSSGNGRLQRNTTIPDFVIFKFSQIPDSFFNPIPDPSQTPDSSFTTIPDSELFKFSQIPASFFTPIPDSVIWPLHSDSGSKSHSGFLTHYDSRFRQFQFQSDSRFQLHSDFGFCHLADSSFTTIPDSVLLKIPTSLRFRIPSSCQLSCPAFPNPLPTHESLQSQN
jgi:hypothetical protein